MDVAYNELDPLLRDSAEYLRDTVNGESVKKDTVDKLYVCVPAQFALKVR